MWTSIIPNPLHPAIVHLPMALVILLPMTAIVALWSIRRGAAPIKVWGVAAALHAMLALSAWASLATGDQAGEKVENVVAEAPVESHEEAAETFLALSVGALVIALVGLRKDQIGTAARAAASVATVALLVAGWRVGHSGGQLVYRYGAASAYTDSTGARTASTSRGEDRDDH
ncbi:MAG: hypothetical protein IPP90_05660 [Gemmatimonadaceae bacterium]|nr:hypothetical protein [Gemmatimonadaceae bacterium]